MQNAILWVKDLLPKGQRKVDNLSPVSLSPAIIVHRYQWHWWSLNPWQELLADVVDTGAQLIANVVDTGDKHSFANKSTIFRRNFKRPLWKTQGPEERIHEKIWSRKSRVRLLLNMAPPNSETAPPDCLFSIEYLFCVLKCWARSLFSYRAFTPLPPPSLPPPSPLPPPLF